MSHLVGERAMNMSHAGTLDHERGLHANIGAGFCSGDSVILQHRFMSFPGKGNVLNIDLPLETTIVIISNF